jgi:hypothetical protein
LALSLVVIYFGLPAEAPKDGLASLPPLGVLEGMGTLFGSLPELMPEEQTTLAGILLLWAGLFVTCGFGLMVVGIALGGSLPVSWAGRPGCADTPPGLHNVPRRARD